MITYLVTTEQMRQLEQKAVDSGTSWAALMEQAGWGVAQEVLRHLPARGQRVLILVGPGNNGGDALVAARHLHDAGAQIILYLWKRANLESDTNLKRCRERKIPEFLAANDTDTQQLQHLLAESDLVLDGLLGMGTTRPVVGELATIVALVNEQRCLASDGRRCPYVISIDVPTGINSDTGEVLGVAIHADCTVATGLLKRGLTLYPGKAHAQRIVVVDIGIPPSDLETIMSTALTTDYARTLLPSRPEDSHKGTFGSVLVIAGSLHYPGAAILATASAARVGAGLVTLAATRTTLGAGGRAPEVTLLPLPEAEPGIPSEKAADEIHRHLHRYHALLIGPGLGTEKPTRLFLRRLLGLEQAADRPRIGFRIQLGKHVSSSKRSSDNETESSGNEHPCPPLVIDADGLNMLAQIDVWWEHLAHRTLILTPHPGEMKRLLGLDEGHDLSPDRIQCAVDAAQRWGQIVVLKGAATVIAAPDGRSLVHAAGNPALASAGTGDVLAGAIAGLLAQGVAPFDAAALGVSLHGIAGRLARDDIGDAGVLASDLLPRLPRAIAQLKYS